MENLEMQKQTNMTSARLFIESDKLVQVVFKATEGREGLCKCLGRHDVNSQ